MADGCGIRIMRVERVGQVSLISVIDIVSRLKVESYPGMENHESWFARLSTDLAPSVLNLWLAGNADARPRHGPL